MLDEFRDAAVVFEFGALGFAGFGSVVRSSVSVMIRPLFRNASSRKRCGERIEVVFDGRENGFIRQEVNFCAVFTLAAPVFLSLLVGSPFE